LRKDHLWQHWRVLWILSKPNPAYTCINRTLDKVLMSEIFFNLNCINWTPIYSMHKSWSQGGWNTTDSSVVVFSPNIFIYIYSCTLYKVYKESDTDSIDWDYQVYMLLFLSSSCSKLLLQLNLSKPNLLEINFCAWNK
jgi:hypothetical protein